MTRWYFYDPDKDVQIRGFTSEKGALEGAMGYLSRIASRYGITIYKEVGVTGEIRGRVVRSGKKVYGKVTMLYRPISPSGENLGEFILNSDGSYTYHTKRS